MDVPFDCVYILDGCCGCPLFVKEVDLCLCTREGWRDYPGLVGQGGSRTLG